MTRPKVPASSDPGIAGADARFGRSPVVEIVLKTTRLPALYPDVVVTTKRTDPHSLRPFKTFLVNTESNFISVFHDRTRR